MTHNDTDMQTDDEQPPDRAAAGDVSTTGVSSREAAGTDSHVAASDHASNSDHSADAAHGGGHGGHGDDASEEPTLVPTNWKQLILPALILLLVAILVAGPLFDAFASRPPVVEPGANNSAPGQATATPDHEGGIPTNTTASSNQAATTTETVLPGNTSTQIAVSPASIATRTAVAIAGEQGEVARLPVQIELAGSSFVVKPGNNLLPDWKPSQDVGIATWIEGTVANHIMYVPYNSENAALFQSVQPGATVSVTMNTGQVFIFAVTRAERAANGPATSDGEFTVTTAMKQDHAGVTLFLIGDPAADRAVVQADFTGTIQ